MTPSAPEVEELAPRTEDEVREHLAEGKLVEGLQHMSPEYLSGIRRILTVSADTELVSAPVLPARGAARAGAQQLRLGGSRSSRTSSRTRTSATGCSATSAST